MLGVSSLIAKLRTCIRLFWSRFAGEYGGAGYRTGHWVRTERFKYVLYARVHELWCVGIKPFFEACPREARCGFLHYKLLYKASFHFTFHYLLQLMVLNYSMLSLSLASALAQFAACQHETIT